VNEEACRDKEEADSAAVRTMAARGPPPRGPPPRAGRHREERLRAVGVDRRQEGRREHEGRRPEEAPLGGGAWTATSGSARSSWTGSARAAR